MVYVKWIRYFVYLGFLPLLIKCGPDKKKSRQHGEQKTKLEKAFHAASRDFGVPEDLLWAVGYLESRFIQVPVDVEGQNRGLQAASFAERTAFGTSFNEIGLDKMNVRHHNFSSQVHAYARWLQEQVEINVSSKPENTEELARWILGVAEAQYQDKAPQRVFAMQLRKLLGEGFEFSDPNIARKKRIEKKDELLDNENLSRSVSSQFGLGVYSNPSDEVDVAQWLDLNKTVHHKNKVKQIATQVEIVHCPYSVTTCLSFQSQAFFETGEDFIGAHYLVPSEHDSLAKPVQILQNRYVAKRRIRGENLLPQQKIVVMLTGISGLYSKDLRLQATPSWLSHWSLFKAASLVRGICDKIAFEADLSLDQCIEATEFNLAQSSISLGNIPDFDKEIFSHYLKYPGSSESVVLINDLPEKVVENNRFEVTAEVSDKVSFVVLEQLFRCEISDQLIWHPVAELPHRGAGQVEFPRNLLDRGPNGDGSHFFRIKSYQNQQLTGWDQVQTRVEQPEKVSQDAAQYACMARGL